MGFLEQIYSLAYLTERKPFWFFLEPQHYRLSLLTTPTPLQRYKNHANVHNTQEWLRMKCLGGGKAAQHTPAQPCSPPRTRSCPGQESGQAAVPTHLPGTATPEQHLRSPASAPPGHSCSPGERSKSPGAGSTGRHLLQEQHQGHEPLATGGGSLRVLPKVKKR